MTDWLFACSALLVALTIDRTLGSAVQLWGMRRVSRHICANLDKALERQTTSRADEANRMKSRFN